jgi:hypothetical protein
MDGLGGTLPFGPAAQTATVPGFQITIVEGPNAGTTWVAPGDRCSIGSHPSNDLAVSPSTSRPSRAFTALRDYLERCLVLEEVVPVDDAIAAANAAAPAATAGGAATRARSSRSIRAR